jgi:murein DD-endopeptidase MepM/ murein hydrolase activator NlpD
MDLRNMKISDTVEDDMSLGTIADLALRLLRRVRTRLWLHFASRNNRRSYLVIAACLFLSGSTIPSVLVVDADSASESSSVQAVINDSSIRSTTASVSGAVGGADLVGDLSVDERGSRGLYYSAYRVEKGDTLYSIADAYNVTIDTVISFNGIKSARALQVGTLLKIPSMTGILYTAKSGETAESIAKMNGVSAERIIEANGLKQGAIKPGSNLFLPDARLASITLREISGDLFSWPVRAPITSWYGWRSDPFTGEKKFHNGLDISAALGTPVRAAMDGTVASTGYSSGLGNYVIIRHHAGWQSVYGHLKSISVKAGQRVATGQVVAYSGNTGYSTGPHLHFSVLKNGRTVNPYNVLR